MSHSRQSPPLPVLALDLGTSSVRAALFDGRGRRLEGTLTQRTYPLRTASDGTAELDPAVVLRQVKVCLKGALAGQARFRAAGVSCFWHSFLGVDAKGVPLTPIYTWADSRCRPDAARLRAELSEQDIHAETGCMLRSSFWPAKMLWLRRTQPALFRRVRYWVSPAEWVQWQLTGSARCAVGMATGTGLFDPSALTWSRRMLELSHLSENKLLPISDEPSAWKGIPWFPGIGDGAASNLGSGANRPGYGAINVGTSAALRIMKAGKTARAPYGLFAYRVDAERYLVGGAVSNAGNLRAWCLRELKLDNDPVRLEKMLSARPTPDHGLTVLPFWTAERAPTWDEDAEGTVTGLRQSTTALDLLQAITEGFYFRLGTIAGMIEAERPPKWIVSGGILKSTSALQRLANVLGRPVYRNPDPEASLRGAAVFALEKLGQTVSGLDGGAPVKPVAAVHRRYRAAQARQADLETRLSRS